MTSFTYNMDAESMNHLHFHLSNEACKMVQCKTMIPIRAREIVQVIVEY